MKVLIIADDGKWLTDDGKNFVKATDLGEGRTSDEFTEITDAEYQEVKKKQEEESEMVGWQE